ncbi:MAG: DNA double-strand break repair nuclease NurA [Candidatus Asgardarchaeia archaeon]
MWNYNELIEKLATQLKEVENHKKVLCNLLREILLNKSLTNVFDTLDEAQKLQIIESPMIQVVPKTSIKGLSIAGIDGSLLIKKLHGFDIFVMRALGVVFKYRKNSVDAEYFPGKKPNPVIKVNTIPTTSLESDILASFERAKLELSTAINLLKKYTPNILLLDGSLFITKSLKMILSNTYLRKSYSELANLYLQLYSLAYDHEILLAGIVKDTRKHIFVDLLSKLIPHLLIFDKSLLSKITKIDYRRILRHANDLDILFNILNPGERTTYFVETDISYNNSEKSFKPRIYSFYLKAVPLDFPLRIEFMDIYNNPVLSGEKVSIIVYNLSRFSKHLAYPTVLIEADRRVRMLKSDLELIYHQFLARLGSTVANLSLKRREKQKGVGW